MEGTEHRKRFNQYYGQTIIYFLIFLSWVKWSPTTKLIYNEITFTISAAIYYLSYLSTYICIVKIKMLWKTLSMYSANLMFCFCYWFTLLYLLCSASLRFQSFQVRKEYYKVFNAYKNGKVCCNCDVSIRLKLILLLSIVF